MTRRETAVFVPVPGAEPAVAGHRQRLDPAAGWGVPAHVTVLYPFVPPDELDDGVLARLATAVRKVPAFDCRFPRLRWFGEDVLWLAPEPGEPFRRLTQEVWRTFPGRAPYGGVHDEVVPHLTVGDAQHAPVEELRAAAADVSRHLPVRVRIDRVVLAAGTAAADSWSVVEEFVLPASGPDGHRLSPG